MPRSVSVAGWKEQTGRTIEKVAEEAGVSIRSAIRYLNGQRDWPFEAVRRLKKVSRGALTDGSFTAS